MLAVAATAGYFLVAFAYPALARKLRFSASRRHPWRVAYLDGRAVAQCFAVC